MIENVKKENEKGSFRIGVSCVREHERGGSGDMIW